MVLDVGLLLLLTPAYLSGLQFLALGVDEVVFCLAVLLQVEGHHPCIEQAIGFFEDFALCM